MNTKKVFLPVIMLMLFGFTVKGNYDQNKYNKTSYNFLDTNQIKLTDIRSAIENVIHLTDGIVTKAEMKFKKGIPVWIINASGKNNCSFQIELSCEDNSLISIEADEGPYEYELKPGNGIIPFSEAKKTAEDQTGIKILKWKFVKTKNIPEYNFWLFLKSGKAQIRVNAETGETINSKKKK